jgi:myo-inositol-1(or 4)-monophosphatase
MVDRTVRTALDACMEAGRIQREAFLTAFQVEQKPDGSVVTDIDRESEERIAAIIRRTWPHDGVLGEESGVSFPSESGRTWVVDPIDGTRNFTLGLEGFGVLIAVRENDRTTFGMVYHSLSRRAWWAVRGEGSFALLAVGAIRDVQRKIAVTRRPFAPSLAKANVSLADTQKLRAAGVSIDRLVPRFGHPIAVPTFLGFAAVAEGNLDVHVGSTLKEWDILANELVVQEAGGYVLRFERGNGLHAIAARSEELAREMMDAIDASSFQDSDDTRG